MKKMKVWSTVLATGVALTTLAACSGGSNSTTASSSEEKADKSQELVIYSNSVSNGRGDWLTAAILQLSNWYPDKPLIDPTCGSGTFCIEAVMIARKMAPGLRRSFAFEEWNWISDRLIQEVRTEAAKKVERKLELDIMGCDIDARMVEIAKANAQAAGVAGDITFKQMRVQDLRSDKINGVIISNPPYGERLSDDAGVTKLYAEMGQVFAPLKTWSKFILTSDEAFESKYGSQADKKRKLYNGTLKVDLYQYFGQRVKRQEVK
ncbi:N-6 adenine-specific DNA methylase [Streptococcus pneumoniae]|nr:N-6 adenine-specific DNA methylase [Streptococcus pneumoniae]